MFAATKISAPVRKAKNDDRATVSPDGPSSGVLIGSVDLALLVARIGPGFQVKEAGWPLAAPVLDGKFALARLREGFFLHCTNILHLQNMTSYFPMAQPGVKVLLKLEGNALVKFGGVPITLDAGLGAAARPCGAVFTLCQAEDFERICWAGTRERMVVITLTHEWIAASGFDPAVFQSHLALCDWHPSPRAICLAEQLIHSANPGNPAQDLYRESRALELVAEALASVTPEGENCLPDFRLTDYQRVCRLHELLVSGSADKLSMAVIAQKIGCNSNTLQRQFRAAFGSTIFDFLRERRLKRAANAMQMDGVSVARAAELAGYASQANFSTAFRRQFGLPPTHFRRKI